MRVEYPVSYPNGLPPAAPVAPAWLIWVRVDNGQRFANGPPFVSLGGFGLYKWAWDAEADGGAVGLIDWGGSVDGPARYERAESFPETGRILSLAPGQGPANPGVVALVTG